MKRVAAAVGEGSSAVRAVHEYLASHTYSRGGSAWARFTRGFAGRGHSERDARLPPGQYDTGKTWPVLTAEVTPHIDLATWTFRIEGLVDRPTTWTLGRDSRAPVVGVRR